MKTVRSIFVSDLHLGCKFARADALLAFLKQYRPQFLYLVGDFVDGWRLRKAWYWNDTYSFLLRRLVKLLKQGTLIRYTPGNHDEFLRHFIEHLGSIEIADEFIHHTADGQRLLVLHGDQFDSVVRHARFLSMLGDTGYNLLLAVNRVFNRVRRKLGFGYWSLSAYVKHQVKRATSFISRFEDVATRYAASRDCDGVVCGHIHTPRIAERNGVRYLNTGDWVESCTALVEYADGTIDLIHFPLDGPEACVENAWPQEEQPVLATPEWAASV